MIQNNDKIATQTKTRNPVFDIMKGFCILLIMIDHISETAYVSIGTLDASLIHDVLMRFICLFHVPMFFVLAGYFTKPQEKLRGGRDSQSNNLQLKSLTV